MLKKLHHQHIGQLYQVVETDRMFYMIMEVGVCVCLFMFLFGCCLVYVRMSTMKHAVVYMCSAKAGPFVEV